MADLPGAETECLAVEPLLLQEAAGHGGDERRVEGGEAGELDADFLGQCCLP